MYEVITDKTMKHTDIIHTITHTLMHFLGQLHYADAGIQFLPHTTPHTGIIRVNHTNVDHVKAGLTFTNTINKHPVLIRSLGVSGILNKAQSKYTKRGINYAS